MKLSTCNFANSWLSVTKVTGQFLLAGSAFLPIASLTPTALAAGFADILFVIDESGSMSAEHAWLQDASVSLNNTLLSQGIGGSTQGNRFGLVGFGKSGSGIWGRSLNVGDGLFGSASEFQTAAHSLVRSGGIEDGYSGIDFALSTYSPYFREGAAVNVILVTDEDRDNYNRALTFSTILDSLNVENALLNVVVNQRLRDSNGTAAVGVSGDGNAYIADGSGDYIKTTGGIATTGFGTTEADYVDLAWSTNVGDAFGAAWDLNYIRQGGLAVDSFTKAFANIKTEEIDGQLEVVGKVPEPSATIALLSLGVLGASSALKRKQQ